MRLPDSPSGRAIAAAFRPRTLTVVVLLVVTIASALVVWFSAAAIDHGVLVERRDAPDRPGPVRIERGFTSEVLRKVLEGVNRPQWVIWLGSIEIPARGIRGFRLQAKDGAQLFIDGRLAVQATGRDAVRREASLSTGAHDLRLIYEHLEGTPEINLEWLDPSGRHQTIPAHALAPERMPRAAWFLRRHLAVVAVVLAVAWVLVIAAVLVVFAGPPVLRLLELDGLRSDRLFRLVLAFSLLLSAYPAWWGLSVAGYWAMDEIGVAAVSYGMAANYSGGWYDKYPPLHYYIINLTVLPFFAAQRIGAFSVFDQWVYPIESLLGRAVSIAFGLGSVACVHASAAAAFGRRAGLLAAVVWTTVLPFVYHVKLATLDVPYAAWFALSVLGYVRIIQRGRQRDHLVFAAAAVLAVCTKDQAYGLFALPALHIYYATITRARPAGAPGGMVSRLLDRRILWAVALGIGLFAAVHNLAFNVAGFMDHLELITGVASVDFRVFDPGPAGQWWLLLDVAGQVVFCAGWPATLAAVVGLVRSRTADGTRYGWLAFPALSYHLTFLTVVGYCYDRFLLPVCLILSIFAGHGLATMLDLWPQRRRLVVATVAVALAYATLRAASVNLLMAADGRDEAARWLRANVTAQELVGTAGPQEYHPPAAGRLVHLIPTIEEIERAQPDYLVVNTGYRGRFRRETLEGRAFFGLEEGRLPYRVVHRVKHRVPLAILSLEAPFREGTHISHTSLNKINPELLIYKRVPPSR